MQKELVQSQSSSPLFGREEIFTTYIQSCSTNARTEDNGIINWPLKHLHRFVLNTFHTFKEEVAAPHQYYTTNREHWKYSAVCTSFYQMTSCICVENGPVQPLISRCVRYEIGTRFFVEDCPIHLLHMSPAITLQTSPKMVGFVKWDLDKKKHQPIDTKVSPSMLECRHLANVAK
ncbi:hypothetical protein AVEN_99801-1 [Araneus ventricosus]|uniref:Uncharacterized protein n=1 Tax=Araneus ventricosus TaxID=182803 RepID=A0A4Y2Q4W9_ARAVE|nr:hypothetical protein AVEN_34498-1 [Araneus ventricosus]GBN59215.1 hypothetical protein AVEN_99801-1 [Araneus ventricosus]